MGFSIGRRTEKVRKEQMEKVSGTRGATAWWGMVRGEWFSSPRPAELGALENWRWLGKGRPMLAQSGFEGEYSGLQAR